MAQVGFLQLIIIPALGFVLYYTILLVLEARNRKNTQRSSSSRTSLG